ncbi:NAD(P)/FAD-dependent oxidoreductase [Sandarakinorhabdus sp.]|uniref:NAD(P)/FAD-dependent oxidoreductase n=1 Tax=Sandarakinorhabdus sp. TaxID=1916663 RepID=UPI00286DF5BA|nr:NAD(P)/FAD-dependent oxidoreductase [Sandarakinorhabdus sp.]
MTQTPSSEKPTVAVVGGGLAGISAAIQLQKAGFAVTLFEASNTLGGNTSSCVVDGVEHDVYPHMFCDWYANFWNLFEGELGRKREDRFEPHATVKMRVRDKPDYVELHNPTSIPAVIANLGSGALMPAQMFLLGYADTDLVAFPFDRSGRNQLQMLDVNGYLYSRG